MPTITNSSVDNWTTKTQWLAINNSIGIHTYYTNTEAQISLCVLLPVTKSIYCYHFEPKIDSSPHCFNFIKCTRFDSSRYSLVWLVTWLSVRNVGWTESQHSCTNNCPSRINRLMHIQKVTYNNRYKLGKVDTARQVQLEAFTACCTKPTPAASPEQ